MRKFHLKNAAAQRMQDPGSGPQIPDSSIAEEQSGRGFPEEIRLVWRTDVGRVRKSNQDAVILGDGFAGVADGMGGHNGGETASSGLRDGLLRELKGKNPDPALLENAVRKINLELWEQQEHNAALTGMGTTLTVLWAAENEMIIAQVGDSRAYLLRGGELRQITADHSLVADMVRRGVLTEEQAACHPMRNYITRAVGTDDTIEVDMYCETREPGDRWLICSDGLYGQMGRAMLQELVSLENENTAADRLLQTALDQGGKDNISLILLTDLTGKGSMPEGASSEEEKQSEEEAEA
ncbi:MAG: Stp1/IreP family PP2C-type Ser/Thr phosphatase [Clostridia bacterium]|nr:Stp1/IreP family PP2C-type Ser/Thr phosphatase [Clostridia bacterium]